MAQNVNPDYDTQASSTKRSDESSKFSSDNHAVTKRQVFFFPNSHLFRHFSSIT